MTVHTEHLRTVRIGMLIPVSRDNIAMLSEWKRSRLVTFVDWAGDRSLMSAHSLMSAQSGSGRMCLSGTLAHFNNRRRFTMQYILNGRGFIFNISILKLHYGAV